MNIPAYFRTDDKGSQDFYQEDLNQTLQAGVSGNGFVIPTVTAAQLTTDTVVDRDGNTTTLDALMANGTIWYVSDTNVLVAKINGALRQLDTSAYP
jgi:hypothetical protein